ncbi:MAG TPA: imidazole glycerol phosphate synthase subunit HisH, partial [Ruminococcaceae bacterium]|nr:imidazole glycerol phosphate synthase subunit HisH [Oscillospiraceae bacterium]
MIAVVDYGVGNLFSLKSSFAKLGAEICVTGDKQKIMSAEKIVLPGVGAFGDAACKLKYENLDTLLVSEAKKG